MDYEKFKQDMEQDVLKNLANRGVEAETAVQHIDKLNDGYDALTVKAPGSVIGVNINLSSAFEAYEDGRDYIDIVERASDQAAKGITESKSFDIDKVNDYDQMKQTLSMEVVSAERNADMLEKVPHRQQSRTSSKRSESITATKSGCFPTGRHPLFSPEK